MTSSRGRLRPSGDHHDWNRIERYLTIHHRHLDDRRGGFIVDEEDNLAYDAVGDGLKIIGRIHCAHGLFVDVNKTLAINEDRKVRTIQYSYHAGVIGPEDRSIFRYDNAHIYHREGHPDAHHCHRFNPRTWQEIEPEEWVGHDRWPTLGDVLDELEDWWDSIGRHLLPE